MKIEIHQLFCYSALILLLLGCQDLKTGEQYYQSGLVHFKSGDHGDYHDLEQIELAIENFEKSIKKGFKQRDVFDKLTWSYRFLNDDNENMERIYSLALSNFPKDIEFYFRRGACRKELKEHKAALKDFDQAILIDKKRQYEYINDVFYERGAMKYILGDTINANKDRILAQRMTDYDLRTYEDYCK